tara:strand:+ start:123 stop:836 length:714 start_codon:yes stop_codon:yes gene_type:complete
MENYLYFRKIRTVKSTHTQTGTQQAMTAAFPAADIGVAANNDNLNEIAAISVTSLDGGGTGNASVLFDPTTIVPTLAYSTDARAVATGSVHWIEPSTQAYANGILTLDGDGTAGGYTLDTGDIITVYWKTGLETAFMYPVSALKGMVATDTDTTSLHFASIVGSATDDVVTIEHTAGKFEDVCKMLNDACNAYPKDGKLIKVIDGSDGIMSTFHPGNPAGITSIEYAPQGGAAGMAT